jgi:hypothetical protein
MGCVDGDAVGGGWWIVGWLAGGSGGGSGGTCSMGSGTKEFGAFPAMAGSGKRDGRK